MVVIEVKEHGSTGVIQILERVSQDAQNLDVAWNRIHRFLIATEAKQFAYGGRGPNQWPQLSPVTIADKRRRGLRLKRMHATEQLADSLRHLNDSRHIWRVRGDTAEFGSYAKAFAPQQFNEEGGRFPFRPPVDLTDNDVRRVTKIINDHIMSGAAGRQFKLLGLTKNV